MENIQILKAFLNDLSKNDELKQKFIVDPEKTIKDIATPLAADK